MTKRSFAVCIGGQWAAAYSDATIAERVADVVRSELSGGTVYSRRAALTVTVKKSSAEPGTININNQYGWAIPAQGKVK